MRRVIFAWVLLCLLGLLGGCSKGVGTLAGAALGGGPKVAANVQAGRSNVQQIGGTLNQIEQTLERPRARSIEQSAGETGVRAEEVQTVVVNSGAPWALVYVLAALCALFLCLTPPQQLLGRWLKTRKLRGQEC